VLMHRSTTLCRKTVNTTQDCTFRSSSADSACQISLSNAVCVWVCVNLDVNHGGKNGNDYTQKLVNLHVQTFKWTLIINKKAGRSDLLYWSKSPKNWTWIEMLHRWACVCLLISINCITVKLRSNIIQKVY